MNSSQLIKLAVVLFLVLGKHIGEMSAGLSAVLTAFIVVYLSPFQGTAGTLPHLEYEWLLDPYWSSVELNSRLPFHCTGYIVGLKIVRHFTVCYVGFSSTPVYLAPFELQILKIFWKTNLDQAVEFTSRIWAAEG